VSCLVGLIAVSLPLSTLHYIYLFIYLYTSQFISLCHSEITSLFHLYFFVTLLYVRYACEIQTRFHFSLGARTDALLGSAVYRVLSFDLARSICFVLRVSIAFQPVSHSDAFESLSALASGNICLQKYMCCFCHVKLQILTFIVAIISSKGKY